MSNRFSVRRLLPAQAFLTSLAATYGKGTGGHYYGASHVLTFCPDDEPGFKVRHMTPFEFEGMSGKKPPEAEAQCVGFLQVGQRPYTAEKLAEDHVIEITTNARVRFVDRQDASGKWWSVLCTTDGKIGFKLPTSMGSRFPTGIDFAVIEAQARGHQLNFQLVAIVEPDAPKGEKLGPTQSLTIPADHWNDYPTWQVDSIGLTEVMMRFHRRLPKGAIIVTDTATKNEVGIYCHSGTFGLIYQKAD